MSEDRELLNQAYGRRVEYNLPTGEKLVAKPLDFETALRFLELLDKAQEEQDLKAIRTIAKEFPEAIEAGDQLRGLTMVEVFDVVRFFIASRPIGSSEKSPSDRTGPSESSPSPTPSPTTPPPMEGRPSLGFPGPSSSSSREESVA